MSSCISNNRFLRVIPGRMRIEINGLKQNQHGAELISQAFSTANGIIKAEPCTATGRLLLLYDEKRIALQDIFNRILDIETQMGLPVSLMNSENSLRSGTPPYQTTFSQNRKFLSL